VPDLGSVAEAHVSGRHIVAVLADPPAGAAAVWAYADGEWRALAGPRLTGVTVLPDGSAIGLEALDGGHCLVRTRADGTLVALSDASTSGGPPVVDPQGRRVAWPHVPPADPPPVHRATRLGHDRDGRGWLQESVRQVGVWALEPDAAPAAPVAVTAGTVDAREPCWSPDGATVYLVRDRDDDLAHDFAAHLVAFDVGAGTERVLTAPDLVPAHPVVADDGALLFVALTHPLGVGGRADLLRLDPRGGRPESHVPGGLDDLAHPLTAFVSGLHVTAGHVVVPQAVRGRTRLLAVPTEPGSRPRILLDEPVELAAVSAGPGGVVVRTAAGARVGEPEHLADIADIADLADVTAAPPPVRPPAEEHELVEDGVRLRAFTVPVEDGETVDAWLATPAGAAADVPLVVWLHGGPMAQAGWSLPADVRTLLARGVACLYPNYRGSAGRGAEFAAAVAGRTGEVDADDVLQVVDHVVAATNLDGRRIGVQGSSYGGYLAGLLHLRDRRFAAAVLDRAITSWPVHRGCTDYGLAVATAYDTDGAPDPLTAEVANSAPVLLVTGELDRRCSPDEARLLFTRLREAGVAAELAVLPGVGHRVGAAPRPLLAARAELIGTWWTTHLGTGAPDPGRAAAVGARVAGA
jgi:dipeptidyl aminopeptidase/acylaminoacyl peptidase